MMNLRSVVEGDTPTPRLVANLAAAAPAPVAAPITAAPTTSGLAAIPTAAPTPVAAPAPPVDPTAGLTFDPTSGKWGTYARAGWQTDYANIFTPAEVQPTGGYLTQSTVNTGSVREPSTSTVYTWNVGEDPAVTAAYARGTAAGNIWGLNYDQFAKAMAPYGGPNASFSDPNGAGPQLQLAANPFGKTGTTWQPSGASSGITFIPKGTRPMLTSGGRKGTPTYGPATTEDQWKISGDMSQLMGAEGTNAHTDVTYHKVGDQLVPVDNPSNWTWQSSSLLQPLLIASAVIAAAYTGGASLSALGGEAAAAGAGAAGAGAAGAGLAAGEAAAATVATAASTAGMTVSSFLAAPAMSIGTALGLEGTAAQLVGSTIINTAMNGGDVGAAIKSAGLSYGLNLASGTLNNAVNTALADSGLPTAATDAISKGITGATISAVTGGDPLQGLIGAEIGVATKGITDNITGFKDLPPQVQNAVNTAIKGELQGKSGDQITQSVLNNALQAGYKTVEKAGAGAIDSLLNTPTVQAYTAGTGNNLDTNPDLNGDPAAYGLVDPNAGADALGLSTDSGSDKAGSTSADVVQTLTDAGLTNTAVTDTAATQNAPAAQPNFDAVNAIATAAADLPPSVGTDNTDAILAALGNTTPDIPANIIANYPNAETTAANTTAQGYPSGNMVISDAGTPGPITPGPDIRVAPDLPTVTVTPTPQPPPQTTEEAVTALENNVAAMPESTPTDATVEPAPLEDLPAPVEETPWVEPVPEEVFAQPSEPTTVEDLLASLEPTPVDVPPVEAPIPVAPPEPTYEEQLQQILTPAPTTSDINPTDTRLADNTQVAPPIEPAIPADATPSEVAHFIDSLSTGQSDAGATTDATQTPADISGVPSGTETGTETTPAFNIDDYINSIITPPAPEEPAPVEPPPITVTAEPDLPVAPVDEWVQPPEDVFEEPLPDLPPPIDEQPWVQPNPDDLLPPVITPPVITPPVVTPPVVVPPKVTPKAATPTPAAPQQYTTTTSSVPTALADIHQMDFSGWNMNDLVKYLQESKTGAQNKPQTPIFAAEGGSIDDLIEYLRS